jgi:hypothetical protein
MKFLLTFFITNMVVALIWGFLFHMQLGQPTYTSQWTHDAYNYKEAIADKIVTNKVVIVAGSNGLFGFDCEALSEAFGMPVVNGAVNAGLGLDYILYRSKDFLKKGDIAILPLEYSFYQSEAFGGTVLADYILAWDLEYYKQLSLIRKIKIFFLIDNKRLCKGLKRIFVEEVFPQEPMYNLNRLDEYGDHKNMQPDELPNDFYETKRKELSPDIRTDSDVSKVFVSIMDDYIEWARIHGVKLVFIPQAQMYFEEYEGEISKTFYRNIAEFYARRNAVFVGDPYDYMYPKEEILDTRAHLNLIGVKKRTKQVINDLYHLFQKKN